MHADIHSWFNVGIDMWILPCKTEQECCTYFVITLIKVLNCIHVCIVVWNMILFMTVLKFWSFIDINMKHSKRYFHSLNKYMSGYGARLYSPAPDRYFWCFALAHVADYVYNPILLVLSLFFQCYDVSIWNIINWYFIIWKCIQVLWS